MESIIRVTLCSVLLLSLGCNHNKQVQPVMVSSAGAAGYALAWPERLSAETETLNAEKQKATELAQQLGTRTPELRKGVDPVMMLTIVQQSDEAGRGEAYASASEEQRGLHAFWDDERGKITSRVVGSTQKPLTEANCEKADVGGPISYALKDSVEKQLEKRLRAHNEAQRTIERNKGVIGAANVPAVQKLADDIALASYLVNIELVLQRNRIDRLLSERSDIESTLEDETEWEKSFQGNARTPTDKKTSQERVAELEKSRAMLAPAANNAEAARKDIDPLIENVRKEYQASLDALENELKNQAARQKK